MIWNGIGIILLVCTLLTVLYCWNDARKEANTEITLFLMNSKENNVYDRVPGQDLIYAYEKTPSASG